jgi:thiosulfate/3-mercaptopyruvate sulfurtransferase
MTRQQTQPHFDTLIQAHDLAALLASGHQVAVFDVSFDLANPAAGRQQFDAAHLQGARYLHLDDDLSGPKAGTAAQNNACGGRHPLPSRDELAIRLGQWGIDNDTQVVVYDRSPAPFTGMFAVRLWGLLRWAGHRRVAVLDGGWTAWQAFGGAVASGASVPGQAQAATFRLGEPLLQMVGTDQVRAHLGHPDRALVDARAPERFSGAVEPLDPVGGHIPGAINRFFTQNIIPAAEPKAGFFKPGKLLRHEFDVLLGATAASHTIHQCGSGVTALHNLLAMELAGLPGSALYAGSWSEWCADPARPVARSV